MQYDTVLKPMQPPIHSCRPRFRHICGSLGQKCSAGKITYMIFVEKVLCGLLIPTAKCSVISASFSSCSSFLEVARNRGLVTVNLNFIEWKRAKAKKEDIKNMLWRTRTETKSKPIGVSKTMFLMSLLKILNNTCKCTGFRCQQIPLANFELPVLEILGAVMYTA